MDIVIQLLRMIKKQTKQQTNIKDKIRFLSIKKIKSNLYANSQRNSKKKSIQNRTEIQIEIQFNFKDCNDNMIWGG